jgi:uncharacterized protein YpmB
VLKQVTGRKFSKTAQWLIVIAAIIIVIALFILLVVRPPQKPIESQAPLGILNQPKEIGLT